jgi:hypothetical protein
MDSRPSPVAEIEELLRRYLRAHPQALDTERGICEWWLGDARGGYSLLDVRAAIERLVATGELVKVALPDGQCTYSSSDTHRSHNS